MRTIKRKCGCIIKRWVDKETGFLIRTQQCCKECTSKPNIVKLWANKDNKLSWEDLER